MSSQDKSLKSQMRKANKLGAEMVLILGGDELAKGKANLKDMREGTQEEVDLAGVWARFTPEGEVQS